jgi:hypothetical protein
MKVKYNMAEKIKRMAKISLIISSVIILINGLLHLYGIFFSQDLYPEDNSLITILKSSNIRMDKSGNLWKLWIGFNAMFSVGLIFIGSIILSLAIKHFTFLSQRHFILLLNILSIGFFVWVGHVYVIAMLIPLILCIGGYASILLKRSV